MQAALDPHRKRPPLNLRERLLVILTSSTLLWTLWALGGNRPWAMIGTAILASLSFATLFWPMKGTAAGTARANLRHMLRTPLFWLGLGLLCYVAVQALNARHTLRLIPGGAEVISHDFIAWLPSGVIAPLRVENTAQMLLQLSSAWLLGISAWVGLRRRSAHEALLWVISISTACWSAVGVAQRMTGTSKMLWIADSGLRPDQLWGTLSNENHAAALLNLGLIASLTLFMHGFGPGKRGLLKGGPQLMCLPLALACLAGLINTGSRGGLAITLLIVAAFLLVGAVRVAISVRSDPRGLVILGVALVLCAIGTLSIASGIDVRRMRAEWRSLQKVADTPSEDLRYYINMATLDLIEMRPAYGWGAGTYRYFIQQTQGNYEPLAKTLRALKRQVGYAHNDYLQFLAELGIAGCLFLVGMAAYMVYRFFVGLRRVDGGLLFGGVALGIFLLHPLIEFFFYRPAVMMQFVLTAAVIIRMVDLTKQRSSRASLAQEMAARAFLSGSPGKQQA